MPVQAPSIAERIRLAGMRASAGAIQAYRGAGRPVRYLLSLRKRPPAKLIIAPQDIRTADATVAEEIYSGYFAFGGKAVNVHGSSPFMAESPSPEWENALMGFGWLRDLRAAGTPLARANAAALVDEWIALLGSRGGNSAWTVSVASRRLLSFLSHSPLVLENADLRFYRAFMRSIGRHIAFLGRELAAGGKGEARLLALIALTSASLCTEGTSVSPRRMGQLLGSEIERQILLDGAHIGRNPNTIVELLLDFLPLRQAFVARSLEVPPELVRAIDRMLPMLRLFRHTDGSLALFNGMGHTQQDALSTVLAYDDARAKPLMNAIASGFQRVEAGGVVVIADMGKPPPPDFSGEAHAGTLAFELSCGNSRIVVNCGAPVTPRGALRDAARVTAAHSTLAIDEAPSSLFAGYEGADRLLAGRIISGPRHVTSERYENEDGVTIQGSHDGYVSRFGFVHERGIAVNADGSALAGRDHLTPSSHRSAGSEQHSYTIRFHLHPSVRAGSIDGGRAALLVTADGQQWVFRSQNGPVAIEESVFFASPDGPRTTSQLVLSGPLVANGAIDWSFERQIDG
ncbi:MAG: heparinase II/III family protein [Hyphomicrobiales bacterium]|nr:heparinase II/III family protein [Hyphomicrobiales bacterium]